MHCTRGVLALGYASMRGYGLSHPTVNEVRLGYADVLLRHPISGAVFSAGRIRVSQAEAVAIGAPNVLRGVSHTGNLSAIEAIAAGVVDMLASDYSPAALIQAAFLLARKDILPLHAAINLLSANPAAALRLRDRGRIAVGLAADIALIEQAQRPRVRGTIRRGVPIYWDAAMALRTPKSSAQEI